MVVITIAIIIIVREAFAVGRHTKSRALGAGLISRQLDVNE